MAVLRKIFGTSIAIAVALTVSAPSSGLAQAGGAAAAGPAEGGRGAGPGGGGRAGGRRGRGASPYTPAPGAKDLKSVLFNWGWYMGMLRSSEERDLMGDARIPGQGHHSGGRTALQPDEVSNQHQLSDLLLRH